MQRNFRRRIVLANKHGAKSIAGHFDGQINRFVDVRGDQRRYLRALQNVSAMREIAHGFVGRPSPAVLLRRAQYSLRETAERLPLGAVSDLPGKAMRRLDQWRGLR